MYQRHVFARGISKVSSRASKLCRFCSRESALQNSKQRAPRSALAAKKPCTAVAGASAASQAPSITSALATPTTLVHHPNVLRKRDRPARFLNLPPAPTFGWRASGTDRIQLFSSAACLSHPPPAEHPSLSGWASHRTRTPTPFFSQPTQRPRQDRPLGSVQSLIPSE